MFFKISKTPAENFPHTHQVGEFFIGTDAGWSVTTIGDVTYIYKGYADDRSVESLLGVEYTEPTVTGNFCILKCRPDLIRIRTDRYRSFPIYTTAESVTNLECSDNQVWADGVIDINADMSITHHGFDVIGHVDDTEIAFEEAVDRVDQILTDKVKLFLANNRLPIKAHLSGGVDSLLVFSYLQKLSSDYELVKCAHIDYDWFWLQNEGTIKSFWGYKQIHHWTTPCVLTSGAPGDEFMLRSPTTSNLLLLSMNSSVMSEVEQHPGLLHEYYFRLDKHQELFAAQHPLVVTSKQELIRELCNIVVNDFQHWHLGNTLTWTPLRDIEIFKTILRMPRSDCVGQILDSRLSKALIERNMPNGTLLISDQKNNRSPMKNLTNFLLNQAVDK